MSKKVKKVSDKMAMSVVNILTKELKNSANNAGSLIMFQLKVPSGIARFRK